MAASSRFSSEIRELLKEHKVNVEGNLQSFPQPVTSFDALAMPPSLRTAVRQRSYVQPVPIQMVGLPVALSGHDLVGVSPTGSGKTLSFLIPALLHINNVIKKTRGSPTDKRTGPTVLILSPTRELVNQTHKELEFLLSPEGSPSIKAVRVYGGASRSTQANQLKQGVDAIVGCPGRLRDFLSDKTVALDQTTFLVLDEADRMLDMGFEKDIRAILKELPSKRQTLMYSATWPPAIKAIAKEYCSPNVVTVKVGSTDLRANENIVQEASLTTEDNKFKQLVESLKKALASQKSSSGKPGGEKVLVFCNRKHFCDKLCKRLASEGVSSIALHGNKSQQQRDWAIQAFRASHERIMVATDVASRGLDIRDITTVINYDMPTTTEDYIHRIGRTGRAGDTGVAITYFTPDSCKPKEKKVAQSIIRLMTEMGHAPSTALRNAFHTK